MLMSLLATPGSPQNGTVDPEREGEEAGRGLEFHQGEQFPRRKHWQFPTCVHHLSWAKCMPSTAPWRKPARFVDSR